MVLKRLFPGRHNGPIKRALPEPADRLLDENPGIHKKVAAKHESLPNFACAQEESPLLQDNSAGLVSQMVAVLGSKGGVGATTFAMNLACAMSQKGHRTTLVDANFQQSCNRTSPYPGRSIGARR